MDIKEVDVAVIYTDGSHFTTPAGTGAGIHGYLFNHGVLADDQAYRHPGIPEDITSRGYKKHPKDVKLPPLPDGVEFVDCVVPVPAEYWADVGELTAIISLFDGAPFRAKNYIVYADASYVVNAWNLWMKNWKTKGWVKADGTPIGNREFIIRIDEIKTEVTKEGRGVTVIKIKAHDGHYGNERADIMAKKGSAMVASGKGVEYKPIWSTDDSPAEEAEAEEVITLGDGTITSAPLVMTTKYCYPMVNEEHPTVNIKGEPWKFMLGGNHAKNKDDVVFIGKMIPDAQFAMFFSKDGWDNTYTMINTHNENAWSGTPGLSRWDPMAIVYNDMIKRKKFVAASKEGIPIGQMKFSEDRNVWMFEDLVITRILRPALLSYRALEIREELAVWLRDAVEDRPTVVLNDITDMLYDADGKPLKDFYRNVDRSFNVTIRYPESDKTIPVILTRGIDIPGRTELNRIKEPNGRYYVAAYRSQERCVDYAVVYIGEAYHGLWCAYYANKRILKEDEL